MLYGSVRPVDTFRDNFISNLHDALNDKFIQKSSYNRTKYISNIKAFFM